MASPLFSFAEETVKRHDSSRLGSSSSVVVTVTVTLLCPAGMTACEGNLKRLLFSLLMVMGVGSVLTRGVVMTRSKLSPSVMMFFDAFTVSSGNSLSSMTMRAVADVKPSPAMVSVTTESLSTTSLLLTPI